MVLDGAVAIEVEHEDGTLDLNLGVLSVMRRRYGELSDPIAVHVGQLCERTAEPGTVRQPGREAANSLGDALAGRVRGLGEEDVHRARRVDASGGGHLAGAGCELGQPVAVQVS